MDRPAVNAAHGLGEEPPEVLEPDRIVVRINAISDLRALPTGTQASLRAWVVAAVGEDTWERTTRVTIRLGGEIVLSRYARAEDGGYIIELPSGHAAQETLTVQAKGPYPVHVIGPVGVDLSPPQP